MTERTPLVCSVWSLAIYFWGGSPEDVGTRYRVTACVSVIRQGGVWQGSWDPMTLPLCRYNTAKSAKRCKRNRTSRPWVWKQSFLGGTFYQSTKEKLQKNFQQVLSVGTTAGKSHKSHDLLKAAYLGQPVAQHRVPLPQLPQLGIHRGGGGLHWGGAGCGPWLWPCTARGTVALGEIAVPSPEDGVTPNWAVRILKKF